MVVGCQYHSMWGRKVLHHTSLNATGNGIFVDRGRPHGFGHIVYFLPGFKKSGLCYRSIHHAFVWKLSWCLLYQNATIYRLIRRAVFCRAALHLCVLLADWGRRRQAGRSEIALIFTISAISRCPPHQRSRLRWIIHTDAAPTWTCLSIFLLRLSVIHFTVCSPQFYAPSPYVRHPHAVYHH